MEYIKPSVKEVILNTSKLICLSGEGNEYVSVGSNYGQDDFDQED